MYFIYFKNHLNLWELFLYSYETLSVGYKANIAYQYTFVLKLCHIYLTILFNGLLYFAGFPW